MRSTLITGGCGFIGTNLAHRLLMNNEPVTVLDNLSRAGAAKNRDWLRDTHGKALNVRIADTRDLDEMRDAVSNASRIFHFAAQVAVTTSLDEPLRDFDVNAGGTLNVLEAARAAAHRPPVFFTSTNKVYGALDDVALDAEALRYAPRAPKVREHGVSERRPLDFHSPYGCSKGCADQYVRDYARSFGMQTVVFRMSCIYGPHQFGNEDQGWVAHFLIQARDKKPITLYGDGKQVRDILYVDDLVDAFLLASQHIDRTTGQAFNIGGGAANAISLLELMQMIARVDGRAPRITRSDWRTGDQKYYVSDTRKFAKLTGWQPRVSARDGVRRLHAWLAENEARPPLRAPRVAARPAIGERARL